MRKTHLTLLSLLLLQACATSPQHIAGDYISEDKYKGHSCSQLEKKVASLKRKEQMLYDALDRTAQNDKIQTAVGMLLFWPALLFLEGGDGAEAEKYAAIKGELDAIGIVSESKSCDIDFL